MTQILILVLLHQTFFFFFNVDVEFNVEKVNARETTQMRGPHSQCVRVGSSASAWWAFTKGSAFLLVRLLLIIKDVESPPVA